MKNPFESYRRKPDVPLAPASNQKTATSTNNLPPTRVSGSAPSRRAAAGFETLSAKIPLIDRTIAKPVRTALSSQPGQNALKAPPKNDGAKTIGQGFEITQSKVAPPDYTKTYAARLENGAKTARALAETKMTGDNYQKVYQAQQQVEAEQKQAVQQQWAAGNNLLEQKKRAEQAAINASKARDLMVKMAGLQLKLTPNMDPAEAFRIHGEIEQLRVALAQI